MTCLQDCASPNLDAQRRVASLSIAKVYSVAMMDILFLSLVVQMTEVAALPIEHVATGTMAVPGSLHFISSKAA